MEKYTINIAKNEDIRGIYNLLHRDFIKKNSPNSEEEEFEKHKKWYEFWIKSPYYHIYVLKDSKNQVIGQIRYELDGEMAIINVYMEKNQRKQGLGKKFVEETFEIIKIENKELKIILAYILEENENSKKLFKKLQFISNKKGDYNGVEHLVYIRRI